MINDYQLSTDQWMIINEFLEIRDAFPLLKVNHSSRKAALKKVEPLAKEIINMGITYESHLQKLEKYKKQKGHALHFKIPEGISYLVQLVYALSFFLLFGCFAGPHYGLGLCALLFLTGPNNEYAIEDKFISVDDIKMMKGKINSLKNPSLKLMMFYEELFKPFGGYLPFCKKTPTLKSCDLSDESGLWTKSYPENSKSIHVVMLGRNFGFSIQSKDKNDSLGTDKTIDYFMNTGEDLFKWVRYRFRREQTTISNKEKIYVDDKTLLEIKQLIDGSHATKELCN